jgi:hypothetical protein
MASDGEKEYYGHATARYAVLISSKRRAVMRKHRSLLSVSGNVA